MGKLSNFSMALAALAVVLMVGCSSSPEKPAEAVKPAEIVNDYPTQDRVEYVLECVEKHGGLRYETLYPCICKVDKLAAKMKYDEYIQARTFTYLRGTPGEKGGVFRDPAHANVLREKLKESEKQAEKSCFISIN